MEEVHSQFVSLPSSIEGGFIINPHLWGIKNMVKKMVCKELEDLFSSEGKLPIELKHEACEFYKLGSDFPEIKYLIRLRTRAS